MGRTDKFKETFFLECGELLAQLELYLGALKGAPSDTVQLQSAFRAIHSVKGGAGMFGFKRLVAFAHTFESAIDQLWKGRVQANAECVSRLVAATDILADLVDEVRNGTPVADGVVCDASEHLKAIVAAAGRTQPALPQPAGPARAEAGAPAQGLHRYDIIFEPSSDMFRRAIEPLGIVRSLKELGDLTVMADAGRLPGFQALDPAAAYFSWQMRLETAAPREAIAKVFEFAAGSARIEISSSGDPASSEAPLAAAPAPACAPAPAATVDAEAAAAAAAGGLGESSIGPATNSGGTVPPANEGGEALLLWPDEDRRRYIAQDCTPLPQVERRVNSIRVDLDRVDRLVNLVGEMAIVQAMVLQQIDRAIVDANPQLMRVLNQLEQHSRTLQDSVMGIRAQPVRTILGRLPRVVRELARQLGKEVDLVVSGEDTEIDKTVIEELSDPLIHLLRNAVDHGIERPAERRAAGKPERGTIRLSAARQGSRILIQIADDGRGIDRGKVRRRAIEHGLIASEARLTDEEIESLTFAAGLSTADRVSKISGRGVGMDIVQTNIERLGGRVTIGSKPGQGTTVVLILPLTLAVLDGMVVRAGADRYVVPLASTVECVVLPTSAILAVPGSGTVANVRGRQIPILSLAGSLGFEPIAPRGTVEIVVVETDTGTVALAVDEIVGQQQVVVKSVRENYCDLAGIAGATLLGDGAVALILDIAEVVALPGARASCRDLVSPIDHPGEHAA